MSEMIAIHVNDFRHTNNFGGGLGCCISALACDQYMHISAALGGSGHGVECGRLDAGVVVFCNN